MKKEVSPKAIIVVLGMHRSGTSVMAKALQVLGVFLGDNIMPPAKDNNEAGFWEDVDICDFDDALLDRMNSAWNRLALLDEEKQKHKFVTQKKTAVSLLKEKMRSTGVFGFKNPRTAILLPFWQTVFQEIDLDDRYLIAIRNPINIANSLLKRDNIPLEAGVLLWAKHMAGLYRHTQGKRRVVVDYDLMLESPSLQIQRISNNLSIPFDESSRQRLRLFENDFLNQGLRHNNATLKELESSEFVPDFVKDAYLWLLKLSKDEVEFNDDRLESFWKRFDELCRTFNGGYQYMDRLALQLNKANDELCFSHNQLQQVQAERDDIRQAYEAQNIAYKELHNANQVLQKAQEQTIAERDVLNKLVAEIFNSRSWRLTSGLRAASSYLGIWSDKILRR